MAPQQQGWIQKTTSAAVAGAGNFAGGIVNAAGNGVAGAGKGAGARYVNTLPPFSPTRITSFQVHFVLTYLFFSVTNTSAGWGDAVRNYGNYVKDATAANTPRASTNKNPLGLSGTKAGAKASLKSKPGPTPRKGTTNNPLGL